MTLYLDRRERKRGHIRLFLDEAHHQPFQLPPGATLEVEIGADNWVSVEAFDDHWAVLLQGDLVEGDLGKTVSRYTSFPARVTNHPEILIEDIGPVSVRNVRSQA